MSNYCKTPSFRIENLVFLKKDFSNLEFSKDDISKILSEAKVTISFSSTVIEDSLNSGVPHFV